MPEVQSKCNFEGLSLNIMQIIGFYYAELYLCYYLYWEVASWHSFCCCFLEYQRMWKKIFALFISLFFPLLLFSFWSIQWSRFCTDARRMINWFCCQSCMGVCVCIKCVGENLVLCSLTTYLKKHTIKRTKMQETDVILEKSKICLDLWGLWGLYIKLQNELKT